MTTKKYNNDKIERKERTSVVYVERSNNKKSCCAEKTFHHTEMIII
jgi:hypothetical protein